MRRLLAAIDGSETGERVIAHLIQLDREVGPFELHLCHVAGEPPILGEAEVYISPIEVQALHEAALDRVLKPAQTRLAEAGVRHQVHRLTGDDPAEVIAAKADEIGADTIVMGTRGHNALLGLLLGSVATGVVHHAHTPVLLVK